MKKEESKNEKELITRVLFQLSASDGQLSFDFDEALTTAQLMSVETALLLASDLIHDTVKEELIGNDD